MKGTVEYFARYIKIIGWLPKYRRTDVIADLIAGVTVGLTMIPQSIAYASLAGLPAQYGLYTAFIGCFTYVFLGSIKEVSIGPTSLMALLTYSYTYGHPIEYVILLTFLVGWVELIMGFLKLGFVVDFISPCVTSGFTSATSLVIVSTQLENFFGISLNSHGFFNSTYEAILKIDQMRIVDTLLAVACVIALCGFKQVSSIATRNLAMKKALWLLSISKNIILVIVTSSIGYYFKEYHGTSPFLLSGNVTSGLPDFYPPLFSLKQENETVSFLNMVQILGSGVIVIPMVAVLANIAIAKSFAACVTVDASQEMIALGICNILGSFIQAMPSCGAFTRSAVASNSGVRTPLQGLYAGIMIILALSYLTPYFCYIPKATLAAILVFAVITLIDLKIYCKLWKVNKFDFWIALMTLLTGLILGADMGIIIGTLLNLIVLLKQWARPKIIVYCCENGEDNECIYIKPECGLFYPGTDYLSREILKAHLENEDKPIILDCSNVSNMDYAASQILNNLMDRYNKKSVGLMLVNVRPRIFERLQQTTGREKFQLCQCSEDSCMVFMKTQNETRKIEHEYATLIPRHNTRFINN